MYFLPAAAAAEVSKCPSSTGNAPTPLLASGEYSAPRRECENFHPPLACERPSKVKAMLGEAADVLLAWRVEVAITGAFIKQREENNT